MKPQPNQPWFLAGPNNSGNDVQAMNKPYPNFSLNLSASLSPILCPYRPWAEVGKVFMTARPTRCRRQVFKEKNGPNRHFRGLISTPCNISQHRKAGKFRIWAILVELSRPFRIVQNSFSAFGNSLDSPKGFTIFSEKSVFFRVPKKSKERNKTVLKKTYDPNGRIAEVEPLPILPASQRGAYSPSVQRWSGRSWRPGDIHAEQKTSHQSPCQPRGILPGGRPGRTGQPVHLRFCESGLLAHEVKSTVDQDAILTLARINGDLGRLGGLLKMALADRAIDQVIGNNILEDIRRTRRHLEEKVRAL